MHLAHIPAADVSIESEAVQVQPHLLAIFHNCSPFFLKASACSAILPCVTLLLVFLLLWVLGKGMMPMHPHRFYFAPRRNLVPLALSYHSAPPYLASFFLWEIQGRNVDCTRLLPLGQGRLALVASA